jgi:hypothetical protein
VKLERSLFDFLWADHRSKVSAHAVSGRQRAALEAVSRDPTFMSADTEWSTNMWYRPPLTRAVNVPRCRREGVLRGAEIVANIVVAVFVAWNIFVPSHSLSDT